MNKNLVRGSLETIIINLLSDHGAMYGYEITKKVKALSGDKIKLTEGALYPKLHKLEADGLLDVETKHVGNRYRKYYKLTESGEKQKQTLVSQMREYIETMELLLDLIPE